MDDFNLTETLEKPFLIVEFDDGVQLVHQNWMWGESQCYWPSFKSTTRFDKAVRSGELPDVSWEIFDIKVIGRFSTWERARLKLRVAEENSDITDTTDIEERGRGKRERREKRAVSSDSESNDESIRGMGIPKPPEPPLKKLKPAASSKVQSNPEVRPQPPKIVKDGCCQTEPVEEADNEWKKNMQKELSIIKLSLKRVLMKLENSPTTSPVDQIPSCSTQQFQEEESFDSLPLKTEEELKTLQKKK